MVKFSVWFEEGKEEFSAIDKRRLAVSLIQRQWRGMIDVSAEKLREGFVRKAPVARRRAVDWIVSKTLRTASLASFRVGTNCPVEAGWGFCIDVRVFSWSSRSWNRYFRILIFRMWGIQESRLLQRTVRNFNSEQVGIGSPCSASWVEEGGKRFLLKIILLVLAEAKRNPFSFDHVSMSWRVSWRSRCERLGSLDLMFDYFSVSKSSPNLFKGVRNLKVYQWVLLGWLLWEGASSLSEFILWHLDACNFDVLFYRSPSTLNLFLFL